MTQQASPPLDLVRYPSAILRRTSKPIDDKDYNVRQLIDAMLETMYRHKGLGLSAIQVGAPLRLFVIDGDLISSGSDPLAFLNPEILELSKEKKEEKEGCLSFPGMYVNVPRSIHTRVRAFNRNGKQFEFAAFGLTARVIQHEYEHLDGHLLIDNVGTVMRSIIEKKMAKAAKAAKVVADLRSRRSN